MDYPITARERRDCPLVNPKVVENLFFIKPEMFCPLVFSVDIPAANKTLQNIVDRIIQEFLQPEVNNLTPKQE